MVWSFSLPVVLCVFVAGCAGTTSQRVPKADVRVTDPIEETRTAAPDPSWYYREGLAYESEGDLTSAESALKSALALDASHAPSLSLLTKIYYDSRRHAEAVALLERHPRRNSMPDELVLALALHYEALDRVEEAANLVTGIDAEVTDWKRTGSAFTYLRLRGDEYREALGIARKALDAQPSAVNYNNYGIAQLYAGDPVAAKESFLAARGIDPDLAAPLYNLAIVDWFYFFDAAGARDWFRRYQQLSEEDPDGLAGILGSQATTPSAGPNEEETR